MCPISVIGKRPVSGAHQLLPVWIRACWGIQCFSMRGGFRCDSSCIHFREVNSTPKTAQETF